MVGSREGPSVVHRREPHDRHEHDQVGALASQQIDPLAIPTRHDNPPTQEQ
jgi:hypothetical protein